MRNKLNRNFKFFACTLLVVGAISGGFIIKDKMNTNNTTDNTINTNNEDLIISVYDTDGKSNITKVNLNSNEEKILVSNREVFLSGNLTEDKSSLVYMDAIGAEPWQVFSLDLKSNKTYKVTNDKVGKFGGKAGSKNTIYFETLDKSSGLSKIAKINTEDKSTKIFDADDKDRDTQAYDFKNNKTIAIMFSNSEDSKRHKEANKTKKAKQNLKPMDYIICELNADGSDIRKIATINAKNLDSISYNCDGKKAIIYGENINNDNGYGTYELSIETGKITSLLTNTMIQDQKDCVISEISGNGSAVISKDGKLLYFIGIPKNSEKLDFVDSKSYPQSVYSYNIATHEINEVYKYKNAALITDLTISY